MLSYTFNQLFIFQLPLTTSVIIKHEIFKECRNDKVKSEGTLFEHTYSFAMCFKSVLLHLWNSTPQWVENNVLLVEIKKHMSSTYES